jgi:hypothetical protein
MNDIQKLQESGVFLCAEGMRPILAENKSAFKQMAMDADPFNPTSNGVPSIFTTIYLNTIVDQLLPHRGFFEIADPMQQGDWTTERLEFPVRAISGSMSPYTDFSNKGKSGVNFTFVPRDVYRMQTTIQYGDLETAVMDSAKLDLVGSKRVSIAQNVAIAFNRMGFFGNVNPSGTFLSKTYGLLNDPNLNASVPVANGAAGSSLWANKTAEEIFADIVGSYALLENQTGNNVHPNDKFVLALDGFSSAYLNKANQYGLTAKMMMKENYPNMRVVVAPEYQTILGFQLICEELGGQKAVADLFTYKYRSHGVMRYDSWFNEKVSAGSAGCGILLPVAIVTRTGIES